MQWLRRLHGAALAGLLLVMASLGTADDKTDPEATRTPIPRGFRMYLVSDGRFEVEANEKKDPDKKVVKKEKDIRIRLGKLHDPVTEIGLNTVIAVFVRGVPKEEDSVAIKVLKFEQALAAKYRVRRLGAFMAFLALKKDFAEDDSRYALMDEVSTLAKAAKTPLVQIGFAEATLADDAVPPQVAEWKLDPKDNVTIILYHRFKIVKRWPATAGEPITDKELQELSNEVDAVMGKRTE